MGGEDAWAKLQQDAWSLEAQTGRSSLALPLGCLAKEKPMRLLARS